MTVPAWAWITWLAVTAGSFTILETIALATNINGTLSLTLRRWLGIDPPRRWRRITIPAFAATVILFVAWFLPHILTNWL